MKKYLIIGNGVAGTTAAEYIAKSDEQARITIVTQENTPFYSRIRLHEYIAQETTPEQLIIRKPEWYAKRGIDLRLNTRIIQADINQKAVWTKSGRAFNYDRLLIATGSRSFTPPIQGTDKQGVFTLRTVEDADAVIDFAATAKRVVMIGGGLLGLECGNALRKRGLQVTVVEFFPRLLPRQLDSEGADRLLHLMTKMGFNFRLGARTKKIYGDNRVTGVQLENGEDLPTDMIIISAGVRPHLELACDLDLDYDKGIKVNEYLQTGQPDVFAAGDVAEFNGTVYGIWSAAMEQGRFAGINMAGGQTVYTGSIMNNTLKVAGIDTASGGNIDAGNSLESRIFSDETIYRKIVIDHDRIVGCIMIGDVSGFNTILKAINEKTPCSEILPVLEHING